MSNLLARLIEAGTPAELVAEVAKELARAEVAQEAIEKRRASDRQRSNRRRSNVTSRDITGHSVTQRDPSLPLPPNENNSNPPAPTHPDNKPAREEAGTKSTSPAKPAEVSEQTWVDFRAHRKAKRAPLTVSAMNGIAREAKKAGWPLEAALVETMARGWQSFKAEFVAGKPGEHRTSPPHDQARDDERFMRRYADRRMSEDEARALMSPSEFARWRQREAA